MTDNRRASSLLRFLFLLLVLLTSSICQTVSADSKIGAVGELQPVSGILDLIGTPGARISEILVKQGLHVNKGDVLIVFSNFMTLQAQLDLARLELEEQLKTKGTKLALQRHLLENAQLALKRSERKLADQQQLGPVASSKRELTDLEDAAIDAKRRLEEETLKQRQLEIQLELEQLKANARLELARSQFADAMIKAPISGTVLEVLKEVGESLGVGEIGSSTLDIAALRLADLSQMYVVSEIYEGDLLRIKVGMKATVSSPALDADIPGVIERISRQVETKSRLAKVWVLLDKAELASRFIGMEVQVDIHAQPAPENPR
ncbi:multidrug resistance protein MdtN [Thiorhodovibrio winogradskyi]|uniref:Multidrug resistance protein MdtN n=1 Tax=Thiorhodovibrio winogradskyi TaxID=77007 RepID=A0ABZ0SFT7_9GAMM|nr:efflux RND transporter periplasmic adaptor subunit [Thiorhodovibrio winogradskyi]